MLLEVRGTSVSQNLFHQPSKNISAISFTLFLFGITNTNTIINTTAAKIYVHRTRKCPNRKETTNEVVPGSGVSVSGFNGRVYSPVCLQIRNSRQRYQQQGGFYNISEENMDQKLPAKIRHRSQYDHFHERRKADISAKVRF